MIASLLSGIVGAIIGAAIGGIVVYLSTKKQIMANFKKEFIYRKLDKIDKAMEYTYEIKAIYDTKPPLDTDKEYWQKMQKLRVKTDCILLFDLLHITKEEYLNFLEDMENAKTIKESFRLLWKKLSDEKSRLLKIEL